jgi:hypothetical protein
LSSQSGAIVLTAVPILLLYPGADVAKAIAPLVVTLNVVTVAPLYVKLKPIGIDSCVPSSPTAVLVVPVIAVYVPLD